MTEPGVEQGRRSDFCTGLIKLVLDPQFAAFAQQANRPNLFGIVGRTYTETWHSMLLGWLLDPSGTHGLGSFALRRLLLAIAIDEGTFAPSGGRSLARTVAVFGEFERVQVLPNERDRRELKIPLSPGKTGRLDVFVSGITLKRENREAVILIEQKVFAAPDTGQCRDYHAWLDREHAGKFHIPILLAPAPDPGTRLVEDERWFELDYQRLHDEVLVPVLEHPDINVLVRPFIEQYIDALRSPMDGTKLAVSEDEREFADQLYTKHKRTFDALFEVLLSTLLSDNPPLKAIVEQARDTAKGPLAVRANGVSIAGATGSEFLAAVVRFLDEKGALDLHVPFSTGTKRFLVAMSPFHPLGNPFTSPVDVRGKTGARYFIETHTGRADAVKYGSRLLAAAGVPTTSDAATEPP